MHLIEFSYLVYWIDFFRKDFYIQNFNEIFMLGMRESKCPTLEIEIRIFILLLHVLKRMDFNGF